MKWGLNGNKLISLDWTETGNRPFSGSQPLCMWCGQCWHDIPLPPHHPPTYFHPITTPPPSFSSILLCQPRSCSAISLRSRWYGGWCRYLWAEQLVKFATHAPSLLSQTHTFQPYLPLCPLSVPISGVCFFIFTPWSSALATCINTLQLLAHDMKWQDPPTPTIYFTPSSVWNWFCPGRYTNWNYVISLRYSAGEGFY